MVYEINAQLGIAFIDKLPSPDLAALGEALAAVLEDERFARGGRICVECGPLSATHRQADLPNLLRELHTTSVRQRPGRIALIARDARSQVAARAFVELLPEPMSTRTCVASDVPTAMQWIGRRS